LTLTELANRVDITLVNLSVLKNNRARAIRFSTLESLCEVLDCQPGDLMTYEWVTWLSRILTLGHSNGQGELFVERRGWASCFLSVDV
jgi:putative transcriptional regulator